MAHRCSAATLHAGQIKRATENSGARFVTERQPVVRLSHLLLALLERVAENVAQRCTRIGRAVLCDGFLLLSDFKRLDRDLHLAGLLVELDDASVNLFADRETLS